MSFKKSILLTSCISVLAISACGTSNYRKPVDMEDAKYWQRKNSTSALYLQGPKAQQILHKNIAGCVGDISELQKLGEIRRAIPANYNSGNTIDKRTASQETLDQWDSPERDGYLYSEHLEYHDFETCMNFKGWERVNFLPTSDIDKANQAYMDRYGRKGRGSTDGNRENVTTLDPVAQNPAPYENTNE